MRVVPSSPRVRRRLVRLGVVLAVAGAVAAIMALVHGGKTPSSAPRRTPRARSSSSRASTSRPPTAARSTRRSTSSSRRPSTGHRPRRHGGCPARPHGGTTLRQWRHGTSPIPYYPARGKTFHSWTTIDAQPKSVDFSLLVHPRRGSQTSSWVFSGQMIKRHGRWLVNGLYTGGGHGAAGKHGRHEVGPADIAAGAAAQSGQGSAPRRAAARGSARRG